MDINHEQENFFLGLISEGKLEITPFGEVYNTLTKNRLGEKPNKNGYHLIGWRIGTKTLHCQIHRLVYHIFGDIPFDENWNLVNHKDGNKSNNHISNLERSNYAHNNEHAIKMGLNLNETQKKNISMKLSGDKAQSAKFTNIEAQHVRELYSFGTYKMIDLAKMFDVNVSNISRIINNKSYCGQDKG